MPDWCGGMIIKILLVGIVVSLSFGGVQTLRLAEEKATRVAAMARVGSLTLLLEGCRARAGNLTEDKESDDAVDTLTDDELRVVPSDWLRGTSDRNTPAD